MDINYLKRPQTISVLEDSRGNGPSIRTFMHQPSSQLLVG